MSRRYNRELFNDRVKHIKSIMPDAFIGVDVIVGFPGESDDYFNDTFDFLSKLDVSFYHVFSYSERENTKSVEMDGKIERSKILQRSKKVHNLAEQKLITFYQSQLNSTRKVLFEGNKKHNRIFGFTDNYIKIETEYSDELIGSICEFRLEGINDAGNVIGDLI